MMNKLDKRIKDVMNRGEKYLICLLPLGDPDLKTSRDLVNLFLESGADIVELGMPSHNPYCDSRQIAESNQRSFKAEPDLDKYFETIKAIRKDHPNEPFEVMAYSDIVREYGVKKFVEQLKAAEIDGHLLADSVVIQPEIVSEMDPLITKTDTYRIRFMPHPFQDKLLPDIGANAKAFVILQAIANKNGERPNVENDNRKLVKKIRDTGTKAAVTLAYGIYNPIHAKAAVDIGPDGILVGTVMVDGIKAGDFKELAKTIRGLKEATLPK
jgi:tryptophan synthase alpha chain